MKPSERVKETLRAFPREVLLRAYKEHVNGAGGSTVGCILLPTAPANHKLYQIMGDRLIDAGRWICENEKLDIEEVYVPNLEHSPDENNTVSFSGSWGMITVFIPTGEVIDIVGVDYPDAERVGDYDGYHHIKEVNILEFAKWLSTVPTPGRKSLNLKSQKCWDILDVGFWTVYGEYVEPVHDHRKLIIEQAQENMPVGVADSGGLSFDVDFQFLRNIEYDKLNNLDLRSDIENINIWDTKLLAQGYVGNRPKDCWDEFHVDDTWAIDVQTSDQDLVTAYLYTSYHEYKMDLALLNIAG